MAKTKTKNIGGKVAATVLAVAILGGAVCAAGVGSRGDNGKWFQNPNMSTWFDSWGKGDKIAGSDGSAVVTPGEQTGMKMTAVRMMTAEQNVETAYELSVTYTPADTTYQETTFTAAWKNPESAWAKGKDVSKYVKIIHTAGAKTAQAQVLQSFEEQVIITASNNRHTDIKATVTVDYVGYYYHTVVNQDMATFDTSVPLESVGLRGGTIAPEYENSATIRFDLGEHIVTKMSEKGFTLDRYVEYNTIAANVGESANVATLREIFYKAGNKDTATTAEQAAYMQALSSVLLSGEKPSDCSGNAIIAYYVAQHRRYNGVTYEDFNNDGWGDICLTDWTVFEVNPTAITTNTTSIIAG